ncbi:MAG: BON domain-containing protein [Gemmatimonadaceae bacterium]
MAHDYEDVNNIEQLDDRELRDLVREHLAAHNGLDIDDILVSVNAGSIALSGRVGTDGERRIADHILTDVLGIQDFTNDLVVDSIRRAESPMDIEEHLADEELHDGLLLGDRAVPLSDESEHLADEAEAELSGTTDIQGAMERGQSWNPPEGPTPEGLSGTDAGPADMGGRH